MLPTPPPSPGPTGSCNSDDGIGQVLAGSIELTGVLGVGAYGTVYSGRDIHTNIQYAVKALNRVALDPRQKIFQDREIQLHFAASQHSNVVSLVKILEDSDRTYVLIEYCPEGDLFSKITEEGHYIGDDFKAKQAFLQILSAVQHCHSRGIYHRDLKPENILVKDNGWTMKLADFGLATQDSVTSDFGCGSTFYMSPECQQLNPKPYACYASAPNDVWALGVILVNLTCGRNPWKQASMEDSTFRAFMRDRNFLQTILPISDELNLILQRIFEVNPQRRITLDELRSYILCCSRFTTNQSNTASISAPPTPPYSPVEKAMDSGSPTCSSVYDPVPRLDLSAQRYLANAECFTPQQTPPSSGPCSPQASNYTFTPQSTGPLVYPYFSVLPDFRRCGQIFANFNMAHHMWTPTH